MAGFCCNPSSLPYFRLLMWRVALSEKESNSCICCVMIVFTLRYVKLYLLHGDCSSESTSAKTPKLVGAVMNNFFCQLVCSYYLFIFISSNCKECCLREVLFEYILNLLLPTRCFYMLAYHQAYVVFVACDTRYLKVYEVLARLGYV